MLVDSTVARTKSSNRCPAVNSIRPLSTARAKSRKPARAGSERYEIQHASDRAVKVWGTTAVVTALLHAKGTAQGKAFEYRVWYSDTYVRFPEGWRYVFGQSSLPLPKAP